MLVEVSMVRVGGGDGWSTGTITNPLRSHRFGLNDIGMCEGARLTVKSTTISFNQHPPSSLGPAVPGAQPDNQSSFTRI